MSDTIELLEAIGRNAALRHATAAELAGVLEQAGASEAIKAAVTSGDASLLSGEFGHMQMHTTHHSQAPSHEEEPAEEHEKDDTDQPPRHGRDD